VLYAHDGEMLGGNTAFAHFGSYQNVDGEIIAKLRTRRHSASPYHRSLVSSDQVTIRMRGRAEGQRYRFAGDVVEDLGSVFRAVMTPLGNDDVPPPGTVGDCGIVSGLYSIDIRMLDGIAGGHTGVMLLHDGRILGGDAFFYHLGAYASANGRWKGEFVNQEYTRPSASIRCSAVTTWASAFPAAATPRAPKLRRPRWPASAASAWPPR